MSIIDVSNRDIREVFVVDRDPRARESIATLLGAAGFHVTLFADAGSLIAAARARTPACIILDLHTPGDSGLDILSRICAKRYAVPILVVSDRSDIPCVVEAVKRGAFDYIQKNRLAEDLVPRLGDALAAAMQGPPHHAAPDLVRTTFPNAARLTPREHEVLAQIVSCASNKEAAMRLGISRRTVEIHRAHIMQKLGARNSVELMRIVLSRPTDDPDPRRLTA